MTTEEVCGLTLALVVFGAFLYFTATFRFPI